ncbi:MAG: hypothetical protein FWG90_03030 [Oscillospiraceae bacterium]|nr:hypothetical protein [Oscillospiraceae bacterium]
MNKFRIFRADIKRSFTEPLFFVSLFLGTAMLFLAFFYLLGQEESGLFGGAGLFKTAQAMLFPFAAPLLCALPYSGMKMLERDTKFDKLILIKIRRTGYAMPRFFAVGVTGAAALLIPQCLLLAAVLIFKQGTTDMLETCKGILLAIPFGFAYSSFAYGLTFFNRKRYIPVLAPQVIYMLCVYAFPILQLTRFYPPLGISPWIYGDAAYSDLLSVSLVIVLGAAAMTFAGAALRKDGAA